MNAMSVEWVWLRNELRHIKVKFYIYYNNNQQEQHMNQGVNHPLDKLINDNSLIMLESMVPFVDYRFKKLLIIYIKFREFTLLMNNLNDRKFIESCGFSRNSSSSDDMMEALLSTMSPDAAANISNAKKMMSMMQTMENLNFNNHTADFSDNHSNDYHDKPFNNSHDNHSDNYTNICTEDYHNNHSDDNCTDNYSDNPIHESLYDSILNIIENEGEV
jgi:hypothetical protein